MAADGGYLQPRPADYDLDPRQNPGPDLSRHGQSDHADGAMEPKQRFDSGVADLEIPMQRLSNATRPRSTVMYDYIDSGGHYEDMPSPISKNLPPLPNGGQEMRRSVMSDSRSVITDVTSDTDDTAAIFRSSADKKKRYNPLYEANTESAPNLFARNKKAQKIESLERRLRLHCACLTVLGVFSIAALALGLYLLMFQVLQHNDKVLSKIKQLEEDYGKLAQENEILKAVVTAAGFNTTLVMSPLIRTLTNASTAVLRFENRLQSLSDEMTFMQQNTSGKLEDFTSTFSDRLVNISKMPGPPGPPGVGNLSACYYKNFTSSAVASSAPYVTSFFPDETTLQSEVVMFAACGVTGGSGTALQTTVLGRSKVQYSCMCSGGQIGRDITCFVHLWLCPRETVYMGENT